MQLKNTNLMIIIFLMLFIFIPFPVTAKIDLVTLPDRQSVQTTIYNQADLTLIRDKRLLSFVKGTNHLQFSWANTRIDPTSLFLEIKDNSKKIDVVEITYPPNTKDVGIWRIEAKEPCQVPVEITYFTSGISWVSFYAATLSDDQKLMDLKGYVTVNNHSGEDYEKAKTRLVVGKINLLDRIAELAARAYPYNRPERSQPLPAMHLKQEYQKAAQNLMQPKASMDMMELDGRPRKIIKEGLSEYFLYTIEGTQTIANGWAKRLLSFEAKDIPVKNIYKYEKERYGPNVFRFLRFKNDEKHHLGQTPLPGGTIKVFQKKMTKGEMDYLGSDNTKYIPVDQKVELNLGKAQKVKVEPRIMKFQKENIIFNKNKNVTGFDVVKSVEVELSNFSAETCTLEVVKNLNTPHFKISKISHSQFYQKTDQDTFKFVLDLEPNSKQTIAYTLTIFTGERKWKR
ncbi:MAG: DUF4139 domain-containing protein [Desulfobacteraceae bacterium]|nr:DUF4139 domain-containing protein [Desulfobacteraceae bacterium]